MKVENYMEIGVRRGRSLCMLASQQKEANLYGFDMWIEDYHDSPNPGPDFVKKELEKEGKKVQLFALTDITNERLNNLRGIDAFIQVACPRISTDNQFDKPVLSTPQANALLKVLRKESIDEYLEIPHWL